jgi:hypothetical protein
VQANGVKKRSAVLSGAFDSLIVKCAVEGLWCSLSQAARRLLQLDKQEPTRHPLHASPRSPAKRSPHLTHMFLILCANLTGRAYRPSPGNSTPPRSLDM